MPPGITSESRAESRSDSATTLIPVPVNILRGKQDGKKNTRATSDRSIAVWLGCAVRSRPCLVDITEFFSQKDKYMHGVLNEVYL